MAYVTKEELERISDRDAILRKRIGQRLGVGVDPGQAFGAGGIASSPATGGPLTQEEADEIWRKAINKYQGGVVVNASGHVTRRTLGVHPRDVPAHWPALAPPMTDAETIEHLRTEIYDLEKAGRLIDAKAVRKQLDEYRASVKKEGERT